MRDPVWRALVERPDVDLAARLDAAWGALRASGVPVGRATVAVRALHPHIAGLGWVWTAGQGVACNEHPHGELELPRFQNSPLRLLFDGGGPLRVRLDGDGPLPFPVLDELRAGGLTDYLALPLRFSDGKFQALTAAADAPGGFADGDIAAVEAIAPVLALLLEASESRRLARMLLSTYVGARAGEKVLEGRIRRGHVELIDAVLLSCDLRGFTALAADVGPEATVATLNAYFDCVCEPIEEAGGEILKFIGDGLLAAFPVADAASLPRTCSASLAAARAALVRLAAARPALPERHLPLRAGVALHVGQVAFGNIGSRTRLDFTVIGPAVNLASRVASLCAVLGRELLATAAFAAHASEGATSLGMRALHGFVEPQEILGYE